MVGYWKIMRWIIAGGLAALAVVNVLKADIVAAGICAVAAILIATAK